MRDAADRIDWHRVMADPAFPGFTGDNLPASPNDLPARLEGLHRVLAAVLGNKAHT